MSYPLAHLSLFSKQRHSPFLTFFFFNDTATTEIYTLSLHDALPISSFRQRDMLFTVTGIAVPPSKYCREYLTSSAASPFAASTSFNLSEAPLSRRSLFGLVKEPVLLQYDPHQHANSEAWQALDESDRIESVRQYHRQNRIRLANESL